MHKSQVVIEVASRRWFILDFGDSALKWVDQNEIPQEIRLKGIKNTSSVQEIQLIIEWFAQLAKVNSLKSFSGDWNLCYEYTEKQLLKERPDYKPKQGPWRNKKT